MIEAICLRHGRRTSSLGPSIGFTCWASEVLGDPSGLLTKRNSKVTLPLRDVWAWAGELAAWEERRRSLLDDLPPGWQTDMPFEEAPSTLDAPPASGPSTRLKAHVGITEEQPSKC